MKPDTGTTVAISPTDRVEPVHLRAKFVEGPEGLPIVEYQHEDVADDTSLLPVLLCFAGGGCSGTVFALLAEVCLDHGIRVVAFDMPGHTPQGLFGAATPPRSMISRAGGRVRRAVSDAMVTRWTSRSSHLNVLSHSAGVIDVARIRPQLRPAIGRFLLCGAPTPGPLALLIAKRGIGSGKTTDRPSPFDMLWRRTIPAGALTGHYGPPSSRSISDAVLARYQCAENVSVPLSLLSPRAVTRHDWSHHRLMLVGSAGDRVCPQHRIEKAGEQLSARGAFVSTEILDGPYPHMFITFQQPAARIARLAADD